jgi:hypothetical protein
VSLRSSLWRYLGLLAVAALAVGVFAGPASAKKLSAKQRAAVRTQLKKEIKKNPGIIHRKSFVKRASLVNFKLPITIRLRTGDIPGTPTVNEAAGRNTNRATLDLGASLGTRDVYLGGSLAAELTFHDSYSGGALGNVDLDILPSTSKSLTSTSIPLLWNTQVTGGTTRWDANALALGNPAAGALAGCGNFTGSSNLPFGPGFQPSAGGPGLPGYPLYATATAAGPSSFLPVAPGVDDPANLVAGATNGKAPGDPNQLGGNPTPFPAPGDAPGGFNQPPSASDTVLRTAPLNLNVAAQGTPVNGSTNTNGLAGSENISIGKSGGQANLFGNIPGKSVGIDVTVSLGTKINSILRIVDQDAWGRNLIAGEPWPAGVFGCRQVYTGGIQNYIPNVRLSGSLKISPGITSDGKLRIAKATIRTPAGQDAQFGVAACLAPYASFEQPTGNYASNLPTPNPSGPGGTQPVADLPVDTGAIRSGADLTAVKAANCNDNPTPLVKNSALAPATVDTIAPAAPANGYTVTNSGASVSVGAGLTVNNVDVDVLIGDQP